ncbi:MULTISPECIES: imidazolonepropionase [unclassified Rhizobium]|uniref:imidazolonepropionase n=1 Tax=unclassified Rhizobium TaxID=2613769 RepID=UPI00160CADC1|nr:MULTISPECIES: imidazolonepropionase [unclassified Rhizobium]MBB3318810.1 imidazolonepropionase [Rhizobium sp. BK181]MBB3543143.1 imidazolonepropionase [Rhizobium sp. BK399]MCS3742358.1 imidazolonepropionase [Rhizobium sp. BK661]MCS4094814.1 imidazolonepropionase [Rhizobium sp. BK176]
MTGNKISTGDASGDLRPHLWRNARLATLEQQKLGLGIIEKGAIVTENGRLTFVGPEADLPVAAIERAQITDLEGRWVTPGLVDCHTHIVYGGNRAREFEMRLQGATYEEIARAGGGIVSSVKATNALSVEGLVEAALPRLDTLLSEGLTTIEIKSGYGLSVDGELKMLRAARRLERVRAVRVVTSYLGAHATPVEYKGRNADYITDVVIPALQNAHAEHLVDAVDGFCETIAFSTAEITRVFDRAAALGLPVKLHAEQLSNLGGAKLAASYKALSADHLEYLDPEGARAMAEAGTVAVLLPGAFYAINEKQKPPLQALRDAGAHIAIATDCNPGTSPLTSLLLTMNMSATLFGLTVEECIAGVTREGARALGLLDETGTLETGKSADFAVWDVESLAELVYRIGFNPLHAHVFKGERIDH